MDNLTQQIFNILIAPPGNLVYHLILAFAVVVTLQSALIGSKKVSRSAQNRLLIGLGMVLLAQLVLFISSGLTWQQVASPQRYLPPLDRAVVAFSLLWIVWLWCFPNRSRTADIITGVSSLVVIILALFTITYWMAEDPNKAFNASVYDWGWELFSLVIAFIGVIILLIRHPAGWGTGVSMLGLMLIGWVSNLLFLPTSGDFSGIVRLAQLCAYPLLPVLAQRLSSGAELEPFSEEAKEEKRFDPRVALAWAQLAAEKSPSNIYVSIARAVAQTMRADLCFVIAYPAGNSTWTFQGGYDLVADEPLPGVTLNQEMIPVLANALQHGRTISISSDDPRPAADLISISQTFGLDKAGYVLAAPMISGGKVQGGIVLLSPYSNRTWSADDQALLVSICEPLMQVLQRGLAGDNQQSIEIKHLQEILSTNQSELERTKNENQQLTARITSLRSEVSQNRESNDMAALLALQKESQEIIASLQTENDRLQTALREVSVWEIEQPKDDNQLEQELRAALRESAQLRNLLAEANIKIVILQHEAGEAPQQIEIPPILESQREIITSIAEDLRQPMTSVMGYSDLLLAELGSSMSSRQHSYFDRIKSSIERIRTMLADLIRVTYLKGPSLPDLDLEPADLGMIVDEAVKANTNLFQEKNLSLEIDFPDKFPEPDADPEALKQMLVDLLRNAASISPAEGVITLRVFVELNAQDEPELAIQVRDNGGGIARSDLSRVFTPLSKASMPLIQGTGDGGLGLVIVQTLAKAQGGDVWVESDGVKTTAYTIRLPISGSITSKTQQA
jgi:signal transduction histidine kinase